MNVLIFSNLVSGNISLSHFSQCQISRWPFVCPFPFLFSYNSVGSFLFSCGFEITVLGNWLLTCKMYCKYFIPQLSCFPPKKPVWCCTAVLNFWAIVSIRKQSPMNILRYPLAMCNIPRRR